MRAAIALAAAVGCGGGHPGAMIDGSYQVTVDDGAFFTCSGDMLLQTAPDGHVTGTVVLCAGDSRWAGKVSLRILEETRADVSFSFPDGPAAMPGAEIDPNAMMGALRSRQGVLQFLALRRGGRLGKSLGPPGADSPVQPEH